MDLARMNIDLEDSFLKRSPGATSAFDYSPSRMIAYGGDTVLCAVDLTEDDDDEYDEEDEDGDEEEEDDDEYDEDDDDEDEGEGEEIDDEEEEIEGDDPDPGRGPKSYRLYRSL